jgi:hypothetical protein
MGYSKGSSKRKFIRSSWRGPEVKPQSVPPKKRKKEESL